VGTSTQPSDREVGFTLIELLIVIVILGALAGIVVFNVGSLTNSASKNGCAAEASSFYKATQAYRAQTQQWVPGGVGTALGPVSAAGTALALLSAQGVVVPDTRLRFNSQAASAPAAGAWYYDGAGGVTRGASC
jgi:prepilin-type N-terminal cleavage/methylation domain-containing protein